jgi:hypothetical protein
MVLNEEDHEAICSMFTTIGATVDQRPAADFMNVCNHQKISLNFATTTGFLDAKSKRHRLLRRSERGSKKRRDNRPKRLLKLTTTVAATSAEFETTTVTTVAAEAAAAEIMAISIPTRTAMFWQVPSVFVVNPSLQHRPTMMVSQPLAPAPARPSPLWPLLPKQLALPRRLKPNNLLQRLPSIPLLPRRLAAWRP